MMQQQYMQPTQQQYMQPMQQQYMQYPYKFPNYATAGGQIGSPSAFMADNGFLLGFNNAMGIKQKWGGGSE